MSTQFPVTANIRGTFEFDTPAGGQIGVRHPTTPKPVFITLPCHFASACARHPAQPSSNPTHGAGPRWIYQPNVIVIPC